MSESLSIVQITEFNADGHAEYRVRGPGRRLARMPGVTVVEVDPDHRQADALAEIADVLILHSVGPDYPPLAARRRLAGRVTILDASDNYFDPQPWQPYSVGWLDRTRQDQFWHLVETVDAVQTSTESLAALWRSAARRVFVFPNHLPIVPPLLPPVDRPLTVGWAGSATHLPDWYAIAPTVAAWVRNHPTARLAVMTDELARGFVSLPADRYAFRPPGTLAEYETFLRSLDIAVVPLLPSPFNRGRTDLKFVELAAHGVVGIYAAEGPYPASVADSETGFLFHTHDEFVDTLDRLATHPGLRRRVRRQAHATVSGRVDAAADADRLEAYRQLVTGSRREIEGTMLLDGATTDGRYHQFPPGEPERAVKATHQLGGDATALPALAAVLREYPGYVAGRRAAARIARRGGLHRQAAEFLEPLVTDARAAPTVLSEAADAYAAAGEPMIALPLAEWAVAANPVHAAAWAVLVALTGDRQLAEQATRNQKRNYAAGLAVLPLLPEAERPGYLLELLDRFAVDLHAEERPRVAVAFGRAIADHLPRTPESLAAIRAAAAAFPESTRLADMYSTILRACGREAEAMSEAARALALVRAARTVAAEYPDPSGPARGWAVAEYAARHTPGSAGGRPANSSSSSDTAG